jgi:uncharacterized protein YpuA (DUF1002 family)
MKQLRQMSILVRGAQLLLLVLALFMVVWLVPDAGKKHASGTEASEAETDGGDVAENEKNRAAGNLEEDESSAGEVIQDDADENASDGETALKRRTSRKQLYKRKKEGTGRDSLYAADHLAGDGSSLSVPADDRFPVGV